MLRQGTCWTFFDGVDEVGRPDLRAAIVRNLESWQRECGENRCLVTSRLYGSASLAGELTRLHLAPLSPDDVTMFVLMWHLALAKWKNPEQPDEDEAAANAQDLLLQIRSNQSITALASNALLLIIMALIHREQKRLPEQRVQLYDAIINTLLDTWNYWRSLAPYNAGGATLPRHTLAHVLSKIALWARRDKLNGALPRAELLREMVRALKTSEVAEVDLEATAQSYLNAVEQAGVLEERVPGMFAFWHPTLEEFLAARQLSTPAEGTIERLIPLRHDPRWREVILLAVGYLGVLRGEKEAAAALVGALANAEPDASEPLIHRHLRLAVACLQDDIKSIYLSRSLAQELLTRLARVVRHQPFEPMGGDLRDTMRAVPRLVPNDELVEALAEMVVVDHTRGAIRAEAFRLLSNAATTNQRAKEICAEYLKGESFLEKDAPSRFHAAIGIARAGEITPHVLLFLVWCGFELSNVASIVELLGLEQRSSYATPTQRDQRFAALRALLSLQTPTEKVEDAVPDSAGLAFGGRLAAALVLLFAGENSPEISAVLQETLQPEHDSSGAAFDAAQAAFMFGCEDRQRRLITQITALQALRRWLTHLVPVRRVHSAKVLLNFIEQWEQQDGADPASDEFEAIYQLSREELQRECFMCFDSCLHDPNLQTRIIAVQELLDWGQLDLVVQAVTSWMHDEDAPDFPRFSATPIVSHLMEIEAGCGIVVSWLDSDNDWLRALATGALLPYKEHSAKAREAMRRCLNSPHEEIRSAVGAGLTVLDMWDGKAISPDVEEALRSCFGSDKDDASRNAAAALYRAGNRDEDIYLHLMPYLISQDIGERFATLDAIRTSGEEMETLCHFADLLGLDKESLSQAFEHVRNEEPLTPQDGQELLKLVTRQEGEDHDRYALRRFFQDWLWWSLEARPSVLIL